MTEYEVGSVASFISKKQSDFSTKKKGKKKKNEVQKDQNVLNALFSPADTTVNAPLVVANVPIPSTNVKVKKNKRKNGEFAISSLPKKKKLKDVEDLDSDEAERILDTIEDDDPADDEEPESEKVARKMKKAELRNIKKNETQKLNNQREDDDRVILVKNLPIKVKRRAIQHLFGKFGKVQAVWLRCAALADPAMPKKVAVIKQEFHPDRRSISAFVRFEKAESATEALSLTGTEFQEQHITVTRLFGGSNIGGQGAAAKRDMSKGVFVGNLPFGIEDEALWLHFRECGQITDVRVVRDKTNGLGKGFGYVNFDSADAVELALKLDQSSLNDRQIRVSRCKRNPKPFVAEDGNEKKKQGAYRRLQDKKAKEDRKKEPGWISKMKQRKNAAGKTSLSTSAKVQSFTGETTSDGKSKAVKTGKIIKKSKEEKRKKIIAAKLAPKTMTT